MTNTRPLEEIVTAMGARRDPLATKLEELRRIPGDEWLELSGPSEREDASYRFFRGLRAPFGPFDEAHRSVFAHVGQLDALRACYRAGPFDLEVFQTAAMLVVVVVAPPLGPDREAVLSSMLQQIVDGRAPWHFFPGGQGEAIRFSTDPKGAAHFPVSDEWWGDGAVVAGHVVLTWYDARPGSAEQFERPPNGWLGGPIQRAWGAWRAGAAR